MKTHLLTFLAAIIMFSLSACAPLGEIRTDHTSATLGTADQTNEALLSYCSPGKKGSFSARDLKNSIEDYGTYLIGFVEYSDQGWEYNSGTQRHALLKRLEADLKSPAYQGTVFINLIFVHGWHHNANDGDCNVNEFRAMVRQVSADVNEAAKKAGIGVNFRINGVYVGWRGESVRIPALRQATIFSRRTAAEHIAKGSVRELFADFRQLQYSDQVKETIPNDRVRTMVVGHSFGGLIAFHSLSQELISSLTLHKKVAVVGSDGVQRCAATEKVPRLWPDFIVLINPAFEASRFEAIHSAAAPGPGCPHEVQRPKMIVVTADNDVATGKLFPLFRSIASIFEEYDSTSETARENERTANLHAIGFLDRYKTHRLELVRNGTVACVKQYQDPISETLKSDPHFPILVVGVTAEIVNGHDGFLYPDAANGKYEPYLLNWLMNVYLDGVDRRGKFKELYDQYRSVRCVEKNSANEVIEQTAREASHELTMKD